MCVYLRMCISTYLCVCLSISIYLSMCVYLLWRWPPIAHQGTGSAGRWVDGSVCVCVSLPLSLSLCVRVCVCFFLYMRWYIESLDISHTQHIHIHEQIHTPVHRWYIYILRRCVSSWYICSQRIRQLHSKPPEPSYAHVHSCCCWSGQDKAQKICTAETPYWPSGQSWIPYSPLQGCCRRCFSSWRDG